MVREAKRRIVSERCALHLCCAKWAGQQGLAGLERRVSFLYLVISCICMLYSRYAALPRAMAFQSQMCYTNSRLLSSQYSRGCLSAVDVHILDFPLPINPGLLLTQEDCPLGLLVEGLNNIFLRNITHLLLGNIK